MTAIRLLLVKDLRTLRRSPLLLALLLAYPLVIAVLVALVAGYGSSKPRVGFVDEDGLPAIVEIAGQRFDVVRTIEAVSKNVTLVRLDPEEARRQLGSGRLVATVTVPAGFIASLRALVRSPELVLETTRGGLAPRVRQQVQALVYSLNRQLQRAYIRSNVRYIDLLLHGGKGDFLGLRFDLLGLEGTQRLLDELPSGPRLDRIRRFVRDASRALAQTDDALRATANPIRLVEAPESGRTWALSAQVEAYALALTISLLAPMLAAGALAAERDENVLGRLARGLAPPGGIVAAKVVLAALVAGALGLAVAVAFGVAVQVGRVTGGEPWERVPLLAVGLLLAGAALGALGTLLGTLARESRAASLVALLVVLPIVFLGLVPREIVPAAGVLSEALPFAHASRFFSSSLYDASPWATLAREAAWLCGLTALFGAVARRALPRLLV